MEPGQTIESGALEIEPIHTPGHTAGMLSLLVDGTDVFTGDTLFKGSVGGVRAPGHTTYADLKSSIMDTLLTLAAADPDPSRPHRSDHGGRRARAQRLRADLARRRSRGAGRVHRARASPRR